MTQEEIAQLPTLLDIVNHYQDGERRIEEQVLNSRFAGLFPTRAHKGCFEAMTMEDGTKVLMPLSPAQHSYYRGESSYHEDCYPTLYRKDMDDAEVFLERVKRCEMELMMRQYPITDLFANSIYAQDPADEWHQLHFRVGYDGMAQHYGIKTEFLDLTLEPLTAAFFAATTYDFNTDTYSPITDTVKYQYGAFYLYNEIPILGQSSRRIDVVGMQPLLRPGRQSAYVFRMAKDENFNLFAQKTFFRHDAKINQEIFACANNGNRLFPQEILNDKMRKKIVKGEEFSQKAFEEAKRRYASKESDAMLIDFLASKNVSISKADRQWFSDVEKKKAVDYWKTYQQELFSKIQLRWSYTGPVKEVDSFQ